MELMLEEHLTGVQHENRVPACLSPLKLLKQNPRLNKEWNFVSRVLEAGRSRSRHRVVQCLVRGALCFCDGALCLHPPEGQEHRVLVG
jgi:hypothetical protein